MKGILFLFGQKNKGKEMVFPSLPFTKKSIANLQLPNKGRFRTVTRTLQFQRLHDSSVELEF